MNLNMATGGNGKQRPPQEQRGVPPTAPKRKK